MSELTRAQKHARMLDEMREELGACANEIERWDESKFSDEWFKEAKTDLINALNSFVHCVERL